MDDYDIDQDYEEPEEMVLECGYPDCCMPGPHFRSECHNGADLEAYERSMNEPQTGAELIAAERQRQIDVEKWTPIHDDGHEYGELARAAMAYLRVGGCSWAGVLHVEAEKSKALGETFPWHPDWWKPSNDPVRNLVKAGALIAAEIDRLQRRKSEAV